MPECQLDIMIKIPEQSIHAQTIITTIINPMMAGHYLAFIGEGAAAQEKAEASYKDCIFFDTHNFRAPLFD